MKQILQAEKNPYNKDKYGYITRKGLFELVKNDIKNELNKLKLDGLIHKSCSPSYTKFRKYSYIFLTQYFEDIFNSLLGITCKYFGKVQIVKILGDRYIPVLRYRINNKLIERVIKPKNGFYYFFHWIPVQHSYIGKYKLKISLFYKRKLILSLNENKEYLTFNKKSDGIRTSANI